MTTNAALHDQPIGRPAPEPERTSMRALLRERISAEIETLSRRLDRAEAGSPLASGTRSGRVALASTQGRVRWLGQLLAGLSTPDDLHIDQNSAGFGSTVHVVDVVSGERTSFTLMTGVSIDVTGDQVSMQSPIGAALVGARPGDVVEASTPSGHRRFRVESVVTLPARIA